MRWQKLACFALRLKNDIRKRPWNSASILEHKRISASTLYTDLV